jgi:uncharacterized protein
MVDAVKSFLRTPHWRRQHRWRRAIWRTMARLGMTGMHALPAHRRWVDIQRRKMPLAGLDPSMDGFKVVQISDLHYSPVVWKRYLVQYIRWVNELEPDLVVITGDLITGGYLFADRVGRILEHVKAKHGVICTFGNHDYSIHGRRQPNEAKRRGDALERSLESRGLIVLRNEVHAVSMNGASKPLVLVGLDDEWSGAIDPDRAFDSVDPSSPIICLNHNPVNVLALMKYPWQWMLAGHTHGRQVATSRIGRALYPKRFRHYTHGYYAVQGRHLYVNRGLSYGQRIHDWCRPEITVFRLACAGNPNDETRNPNE